MKYSEFMLRIVKQGLKPVDLGDYIEIRNNNEDILFCVGKMSAYVIDVDYDTFREQDLYYKKILFNLAVELASTPLEEREDEKRYRLKLPFGRSDYQYLNQVRREKQLTINNKFESNAYKAIFTESEIEELKREHNLDSFVMEEVLEDE